MKSIQQLIQDQLQHVLQPDALVVIDDSDAHIGHAGAATGKGHFIIEIKCKKFIGKSRIECHRLVYNALGDLMQTKIHALQILIQN